MEEYMSIKCMCVCIELQLFPQLYDSCYLNTNHKVSHWADVNWIVKPKVFPKDCFSFTFSNLTGQLSLNSLGIRFAFNIHAQYLSPWIYSRTKTSPFDSTRKSGILQYPTYQIGCYSPDSEFWLLKFSRKLHSHPKHTV